MTDPSYFDRYENLAFSRDDNGVLTMRFHPNGGPIIFTGQTHEDLPFALEEIAADEDNRAMILIGTDGVFMDQIDGPSLGDMTKPVQTCSNAHSARSAGAPKSSADSPARPAASRSSGACSTSSSATPATASHSPTSTANTSTESNQPTINEEANAA
jgi:hypothetical protein